MNWYKKSEDVGDWINEQYQDAAYEVLSEFVRNPRGKQSWSVVPAARLKKIWEDFATYGVVHDEKGLEEIAEQISGNVFRLQVNTELAGHTRLDPKEVYEDTGIKYTKRRDEMFGDYILIDGQWRISDYGLDKLMDDAIKLKQASSSKEKLLIIDNMLSIVHQRSDLPAMFVEGGGTTLDDLFENNPEKTFMDKEKIKEINPPQETNPKQIQLNLAYMSNWYKTSQKEYDLDCPECGSKLKLRHSDNWGYYYACEKYPDCKVTHGAFKDGRPRGVPGDLETIALRKAAHKKFDMLWQGQADEKKSRSDAYKWLSMKLNTPYDKCHIALFGKKTLRELIGLCEYELNSRKKRKEEQKTQMEMTL